MHKEGADTERIVTVLKTVAHPLRLRILAILCDREEHVTGLADRLRVSRTAVSGALALMRVLHIVAVSRRSGHATYRLQDDGLRDLISWAHPLADDRRIRAARRGAGRSLAEPRHKLRARTQD